MTKRVLAVDADVTTRNRAITKPGQYAILPRGARVPLHVKGRAAPSVRWRGHSPPAGISARTKQQRHDLRLGPNTQMQRQGQMRGQARSAVISATA